MGLAMRASQSLWVIWFPPDWCALHNVIILSVLSRRGILHQAEGTGLGYSLERMLFLLGEVSKSPNERLRISPLGLLCIHMCGLCIHLCGLESSDTLWTSLVLKW